MVTSPRPTVDFTVEDGDAAGVLIWALRTKPEKRQVVNRNSPEVAHTINI